MAELKTADILGEIDNEDKKRTKARKPTAKTPQKSISPDERGGKRTLEKRNAVTMQIAEGKPSAYQSDLRAKIRIKRQLSFGYIPEFICDELDRLVEDSGMNRREYLYDLLRRNGVEIPPYDQLDGRKL